MTLESPVRLLLHLLMALTDTESIDEQTLAAMKFSTLLTLTSGSLLTAPCFASPLPGYNITELWNGWSSESTYNGRDGTLLQVLPGSDFDIVFSWPDTSGRGGTHRQPQILTASRSTMEASLDIFFADMSRQSGTSGLNRGGYYREHEQGSIFSGQHAVFASLAIPELPRQRWGSVSTGLIQRFMNKVVGQIDGRAMTAELRHEGGWMAAELELKIL